MSEFRQDPVTGRWVVIAEGRTARPDEYAARTPARSPAECPFCEGNEDRTPPELAANRDAGKSANGPGWRVRTIPNRFPTLAPDVDRQEIQSSTELFPSYPGFGVHEVIIESARHEPALPFIPVDQVQRILRMYRDRLRALAGRPEIRSLLIFENYGPESGGTLVHPHAQAIAAPLVFPSLQEETEAMRRFSSVNKGECLLEVIGREEREAGIRVVRDDKMFLAITPFASQHPYELMILPNRHAASLAEATDPELDALAQLLPALLRAQFSVVGSLSYNFFIHVSPLPQSDHPDFHWHLEITPRLIRPDGFEVGSGISVNPVSPEAAASAIREVLS